MNGERKPVIDEYLQELEETWGYTIEELNHIRKVLARYAVAALLDSHVAKEAENILSENF